MGPGQAAGLESRSVIPSLFNWRSIGNQRLLLRFRVLKFAFLAVVVTLAFRGIEGRARVDGVPMAQSNTVGNGGYVGSKACANCHRQIYEEYSQTDMGRSMSIATSSRFEKIPKAAKVFDQRSNRYFEVFVQNGDFFQTEYEKAPDETDLFRDTHKMEWIIGSGANGFGAIIRRDDFLFEAPLSFYSKTGSWGLSPGYEFNDYGFARPILPDCIACHSGRPGAVPEGNGRFREPPFSELAIGCENCHGPGASHALERLQGVSMSEGNDSSIVNPAKLPSWLADNICMFCHQTGDVHVLKPGKTFQDFRPGKPLDDTLAIFMVPLSRDSVPQSDLLQHYLSMTLSKCYRGSGGRLSCITCHDPHIMPRQQQATGYYRQKCLACHTEKSCAVPLDVRQRRNPPDDCVGCHMPKRDVKVIAHAVLTNHRIIAETEESFPETSFHMTTPQLPDLVHLSAVPGLRNTPVAPRTLLQAYGQLMISHPEFRKRYTSLAKQMEPVDPDNVEVLEALAIAALDQKDSEGSAAAIGYFSRAVDQGSTSPAVFEELAELLTRAGRAQEATGVLQRGIKQMPYDAPMYRLLAECFMALKNPVEACSVLARAAGIFRQDSDTRSLLQQCDTANSRK